MPLWWRRLKVRIRLWFLRRKLRRCQRAFNKWAEALSETTRAVKSLLDYRDDLRDEGYRDDG